MQGRNDHQQRYRQDISESVHNILHILSGAKIQKSLQSPFIISITILP